MKNSLQHIPYSQIVCLKQLHVGDKVVLIDPLPSNGLPIIKLHRNDKIINLPVQLQNGRIISTKEISLDCFTAKNIREGKSTLNKLLIHLLPDKQIKTQTIKELNEQPMGVAIITITNINSITRPKTITSF